MLDASKPYLLRIVGPNCLGLISPPIGLNASYVHLNPRAGALAFVRQSGALVTAVLDWAEARRTGFSHVVSFERAEFAVMVRSDKKGRGLGFQLMKNILACAQKRGTKIVQAHQLASVGEGQCRICGDGKLDALCRRDHCKNSP